jgi:hypothetical protein
MGDLDHSAASLRIMGDDLRPEEITQLLGKEPSASQTKGEILTGRVTGIQRTAKFGMWQWGAERREPGDLETQIHEILGPLTDDLAIWKQLAQHYHMDIFCGAFMKSTNDSIILSAETLSRLGNRGIDLNLDIYGSGEDEDAEPAK